jgi:hypothetical protein
MIDQGRLPRNLTFDDPMDLEGRKVAFVTYGRGIGSNAFKSATSVVVCGEFYRPHRVSMAKAMGLKNVTADHEYLGEMSNVNTRQKLFTTIRNGNLLRWIKQLVMRGNARNFDANGVCGKMKIVAIGDFKLWTGSASLMFPGAPAMDTSEHGDTKGSNAVAAFILNHAGGGFTAAELCKGAGINPTNLARFLAADVVKAAVETAGLSYVKGKKGRPSHFIDWSETPAIAAE